MIKILIAAVLLSVSVSSYAGDCVWRDIDIGVVEIPDNPRNPPKIIEFKSNGRSCEELAIQCHVISPHIGYLGASLTLPEPYHTTSMNGQAHGKMQEGDNIWEYREGLSEEKNSTLIGLKVSYEIHQGDRVPVEHVHMTNCKMKIDPHKK